MSALEKLNSFKKLLAFLFRMTSDDSPLICAIILDMSPMNWGLFTVPLFRGRYGESVSNRILSEVTKRRPSFWLSSKVADKPP